MHTYWHYLEKLSYQTHAKLWALKSSCEGTFPTKQLSETIVVCGMLRVKMPIYTGDHPPIAKKPYALALKHYDWVRDEICKLLEVSVIRESNQLLWFPVLRVARGYVWISGPKTP